MAQIKTYFRSHHWRHENVSTEWRYSQCGTFWQNSAPLQQSNSLESFAEALTSLNGFYAVMQQQPGKLLAAVDHIRSIPLFYGQRQGRVFVSDEAEWVRQQVGDELMDDQARQEFQLTGYVTGLDTLFPNVKQLQAGECLMVTEQTGTPKVETQRYYRFLHTEPSEYDETSLRESLDQAAVASVQRLINYANGRQIVVPLSGGYDSRLIVTLLKRLDYRNIFTFTYGVAGNKESQYSKQVAEALGLRWHFVEYSNELWRNAWQSDERWQYQKWGSGWSSIAHVQDWLAVKLMKEQGSIDNDAIFVPGHSGDFVAGSHIPDAAFSGEALNLEDVCHALFKGHYKLAPTTTFDTKEREWIERIKETTGSTKVEHAWQYADTYEKWDWQERQAKFICNSVRVYEFFGYDWWLPLWDKELLYFFENLPLTLRNHEWYKGYVQDKYLSNCREECLVNIGNAADAVTLRRMLVRILGGSIKSNKILMRIYKKFFSPKDFMAREGRYPEKKYITLINKGYSANGINAYFFLTDSLSK